ncbi:MAG TPA: GNAT family N-acetyltransferase, partial [Candidatus Binatia bacterium]|nr:GNAT family N-acetyltransferase [Candidatus Binatia bacterium]
MVSVHPRYLPLPYQDSPESGRLILRDGTTATIRVAQPPDRESITRFFASLSKTSSWQRFFSFGQPPHQLIDSFCDNSNPRSRLTLIVTRSSNSSSRIIATGNYVARDETTAEVAMAVDDKFQGKGIGMLLLERLATLAANNGFRRFWAVTMFENQPMLEVFRNSGFECHTRLDGSYIEIDFPVIPTEASVTRAEMRDRVSTAASIRPFFHPRSVAVVGASRRSESIGGRIIRAVVSSGFRGAIYPINPKASYIEGLTAYPTLRALPEAPDLAVIAVPREAVHQVIDDCAARGVRAVVVITAGFAEIGPEGRELQQRLVDKIRGYGMRMVGPNCLGLLNTDPAVQLNASFSPFSPMPGHIAFSSQSGALGLAILSLSRERKLGLSHFVSVGNKADVSGNDLLLYWEEDERVHTILLYLESFGNPRRFARIAKRIGRRKPIVAVKAGRTGAGRRAAGSHTAALAASDAAVEALFHQAGVIRAETLDEMFDLATALDKQPLPNGRRVAILTNAGGLG